MTQSQAVTAALDPLRELLRTDGYDLRLVSCEDGDVTLQIEAGPDACADCLVPKPMMRKYVDGALAGRPEIGEVSVDLLYPADYRRES